MRLKPMMVSTLLILLLTGGGVALAQGNDYTLSRGTILSGGGASSGGSYHLVSAIGQPEAGPLMSGGPFTLSGGFAGTGGSPQNGNTFIYLPMVMK